MLKQVIAVRQDINFSKSEIGKIIGWASFGSAKKTKISNSRKLMTWLNSGQKKVVLKILNLESLKELESNLERHKKVIYFCLNDQKNKKNTSDKNELIAIGIGPDEDKILSGLTQMYKLY